MRAAWQAAAETKPDVFVWLNDDVTLKPRALETLRIAAQEQPAAIIVGSCVSAEAGELSYGGRRRLGMHPGKLAAIPPGDVLKPCDTFEGNIVWIPAAIYDRVGNLAPFRHAMGDIDYGYRATRAGFRIFIAPGYLGVCSNNSRGGTWEDAALPRSVRWRKLTGIKGLPPRDWWRFCRAHGRLRAPLYFVSPYGRVLFGR
jgi:GT2 family glycosyltransferase